MKQTVIDMEKRTEHHLLSGSTFHIDRRLERRHGAIWLDRSYTRHPSIARGRSLLLPQQHLWVMFWEGHAAPHPYRCYMHMAQIFDRGDSVVVDDLYLDVVVLAGGGWQLLDVDEFRQALAVGELSHDQVQAALLGLENACRLVQESSGDVERHLHRLLAKAAGA
jgi:hypothetical protein